jgi:DNA-binding NarL/FixJ family response regulator
MIVLIASSSKTIRKCWQRALTGSYPVHEIGDQIGLSQALARYKPTVLLLDSDVIRHRGIRQVRNLLQANPHTRIIFFTDHVRDTEAIAVLKAGASGYCSKKIRGASLTRAISAVNNGELWVERRLISLFIRSIIGSGSGRNEVTNYNKPATSVAPIAVLSPRERDVASMISTGEQTKIISSHLSISEKTVKAHLTNIFKKLGLSSRTQLALFMRQNDFMLNLQCQPPNSIAAGQNYTSQ